MGWEIQDTTCKFADVCSFSPRCRAKSIKDMNCYKEDNRSFWRKFYDNHINLYYGVELMNEFKLHNKKLEGDN